MVNHYYVYAVDRDFGPVDGYQDLRIDGGKRS
jgi:hypothetical protein